MQEQLLYRMQSKKNAIHNMYRLSIFQTRSLASVILERLFMKDIFFESEYVACFMNLMREFQVLGHVDNEVDPQLCLDLRQNLYQSCEITFQFLEIENRCWLFPRIVDIRNFLYLSDDHFLNFSNVIFTLIFSFCDLYFDIQFL